jgi:DnaA family protein
MEQLALAVDLRPEADFADYLPGPNAEAVAAVAGWGMGSGEPFVFLFGPRGTGKTHLLQAACRTAADLRAAAVYLPLSHPGVDPTALDGLERADRVALDDVDTVAGDASWETALFNLYNRLRDTGRGLLVSADGPVAELGVRLPDLGSRLAWGPVYRLRTLNDKECTRLLRQSAARRGLQLSAEATEYILRRCRRDPPHLLTLLDALDRESLRNKRRPTVPLIRDLLARTQP